MKALKIILSVFVPAALIFAISEIAESRIENNLLPKAATQALSLAKKDKIVFRKKADSPVKKEAEILFTPPKGISCSLHEEVPADDNIIRCFPCGKMPEYKGGIEKMYELVKKNFNYPQSAIENKIEGKIYTRFTVSYEGKISKAEIMRGIDKDCDKEALRVVQLLTDWEPGDSTSCKSFYFQLPIKLTLPSDPNQSPSISIRDESGKKG